MTHAIRHYRLHIYISTLFLALIIALAGVIITMQDRETRQMMLGVAASLFSHVNGETSKAIESRYEGAIFAADILAQSYLAEARTLPDRLKRLGLLVQVLKDQTSLSAAYVGYATGDFFLARRLIPGSWLARSARWCGLSGAKRSARRARPARPPLSLLRPGSASARKPPLARLCLRSSGATLVRSGAA